MQVLELNKYPHTVTVINKENKKGRITYFTHVLEGVHYQDKQGIKTGDSVQFTDNNGYVQIPKNLEGYVSPQKYKGLEEKQGQWTLKEGDFIVKGVDINESDILSTEGLRTIDSIEDIDYGFTLTGHYGVTLK